MNAIIDQTENVRCLLVVCLPPGGLLPGFRANEWTILEEFAEEGSAKLRMHRIVQMLNHLKARAFVIRETDPRRPGSMVSWRTIVRFNEPEIYLDPDEAWVASPEALVSWADAVEAFLAPPRLETKAQPKVPLGFLATAATAAVAFLALGLSLRTPKVEFEIDALNHFARQGGVYATLPDKNRPGWYVRVKMHPNGSVELLERISEDDLQKQTKKGPETSEADSVASAATLSGEAVNERLEGVAAAFRKRN